MDYKHSSHLFTAYIFGFGVISTLAISLGEGSQVLGESLPNQEGITEPFAKQSLAFTRNGLGNADSAAGGRGS